MIGIGLDVVELDRFRAAIDRAPSLIQRVFTPAEQAYADRRRDPTERYAVRFAAKEAALKAMGLGLFHFPLTEIEVVRTDSGEPSLVLHRRAAEMAAARGIEEWRVALTHTDRQAQAIAVAFGSIRARSDAGGPRLRTLLAVSDVEATVRFYEDVLGFHSTGRDAVIAGSREVELGGAVLLVVPMGTSAEDAERRGGSAPGLADLLIEVPDAVAARRRAARQGAPAEPVVGLDQEAFVVMDPDGRRILVTCVDRGDRSQ